MIDLHSHTTASDGQHRPRELVTMAAAAGVTTLSVTDHDTVGGLAEARDTARGCGIELIPGIELSAHLYGLEVHILGHFIDPDFAPLSELASSLQEERTERMERMVQKLRDMGFPITFEMVRAVAGEGSLGRPHLGQLLVKGGWCVDMHEAFSRFLGDGKPAWVPRTKLSAQDAVALVKQAGGSATLAHPAASKAERHHIVELKRAGMVGLEIKQGEQDLSNQQRFATFARELDLVMTAGSDFHGETVSPNAKLGMASMDPSAFAELKRRAASMTG